MTSRKTNQSRKLSFQSLEDRCLMAGNVTAAMSNHSLTLTGDNLDNEIRITQVAANQFKIDSVSGLTTVNFKDSQIFTVTGNISVNFKAGNDNLRVIGTPSNYTNLPGSLNIVLGDGNNQLQMYNASVGGNLSVSTGTGQNDLYVSNMSIGSSTINSGNNDARFNLGLGINTLALNYMQAERDLLINQQSGSLKATLIGGNVGRNASIQTGNGNDSVQINEYYFAKQLNIQTGAGDDQVMLGENTASTGKPSSKMGIHADSVFADLGAGNDTLRVYNAGPVNYNGNTGTDNLFHDDGQNYGSAYYTQGFEYVDGVLQTSDGGLHHQPHVGLKV
ncbi:MAG TPA: hypothetical protein VGJ04_06185 [Pirellulales bacterium]